MGKISKTVVISLGGSIIVPGKIEVRFLKKFKEFILKFLKKDYRFIIVAGGGNICRAYQKAAAQITKLTDEDKDWLGIHATRLNAHLLRTIFKKEAYPIVLDNPLKQINPHTKRGQGAEGAKINKVSPRYGVGINSRDYRLFIASGWKPGWSTDYDAVLLAERFKANKLINASNITQVYDRNKKYIKEINWSSYLKLIGKERKPGMNVPFDPVAAKTAKKLKMTVIVAKGTNLKNLENILREKKFKGTIIHPQ